jgi:hypothetical protein
MTTVDTARSRGVWQRVGAWVLVVLTFIAVAGSVVGFWVHRTVLDTEQFMAAVTPVVESESVQAVVADRVGDQLVEALDLEARLDERLAQAEGRLLERLAEALDLPDAIVRRLANASLGLDTLAPMIAAGVETRIRDAVGTFLFSPEGTSLLLATMETAHERSVLLLRDELDQLPNVVVAEGEVRLNLVPLMAEVLRSVVNAGLDFVGLEREIPPFDSAEDATAAVERLGAVLNRDLPPDFGQVRLASEASLERAQGLVRAFDLALWVLVIVGLAVAGLAVWMAPTIPAGLVRVGAAAALGAFAGWIAVQVISAQVVDAATTAEGRVAIGEIVSSVVSGLGGISLLLAVLGIGVVAAGLIADRQPVPSPAAAVAGGTPPREPPPPATPSNPPPNMPPPSGVGTESTTASGAATRARRPATKATTAAKATPAKPATAKASTAKTSTAKTTPKSAKPPTSGGKAPSDATSGANAPTKKRRRPPATGA